jgi:WD40 repeat protein
LAVGTSDGIVYLWEVATGRLLRKLQGDHARVETVAFSSDGKTVVSAQDMCKARFWDVDTGKQKKLLEWPHEENVHSLFSIAYFSPSQLIAPALVGNKVCLRDALTGKDLGILGAHQNGIEAVAFSPDGKRLASVGDTTVLIWDISEVRRRPQP